MAGIAVVALNGGARPGDQAEADAVSRAVRVLLGTGWDTVLFRGSAGEGYRVEAAGGGGTVACAPSDSEAAAQRLASGLGAQALVLARGVEPVLIDTGLPDERGPLPGPIEEIDLAEAERRLVAGRFPQDTMAGKARAAIRFLRAGGEVAVITAPTYVHASLDGSVSALAGPRGARLLRVRRRRETVQEPLRAGSWC